MDWINLHTLNIWLNRLKILFFFLLLRTVVNSISAHKGYVHSVLQQPRRFPWRVLIFKGDLKRSFCEPAIVMRDVFLFNLAEGIATHCLAADCFCGRPTGLAWERTQIHSHLPIRQHMQGKPRTCQHLNATRSYLCIGQPHRRELKAADLTI